MRCELGGLTCGVVELSGAFIVFIASILYSIKE